MSLSLSDTSDMGSRSMGRAIRPNQPLVVVKTASKTSVEKISVADIRRAVIAIDEAFAALYKLVLRRDIGPAWKRRQKPDL
jgi:hypothetical protein